jgi:hypothetical protein
VGVRVAHWDCRFEKSGETGVGVPVREMPATTPEAMTVGFVSGP